MITTDEQDAAIHRIIDTISMVWAWTEYQTSINDFSKKYKNQLSNVYFSEKKQEYKYYRDIIQPEPTRTYAYYENRVRELCDHHHPEKTFTDIKNLNAVWSMVMMSIQTIRYKDSCIFLDKSTEEVEQMAEKGDDVAILMLPVVKVLNKIKENAE